MFRALGALVFSTSILFLSVLAGASESRVTVHDVNGFRVHLLDTQRGSELGVSYTTLVGHMSDPARVAGRAHLFEHMMLKGSVKFPGYHTMSHRAGEMAGQKNAFTSDYFTSYFIVVPNRYGRDAIELLAAPLAGVELKPETFQNEREVVIDEVVNQYNLQELTALRYLPLMHLLPADHPLNKPALGSEQSLRAITRDDLHDLYFGDYQNSKVDVWIAANFTEGKVSREQVLEWVRESFESNQAHRQVEQYKKEPQSLQAQPYSSLIAANRKQQKGSFLYVRSEQQSQWLNVIFEAPRVPSPKERIALDLLFDYLGLDVKGSLNHRLNNEMGVVNDFGLMEYPVPGGYILSFLAQLTPLGDQNREQVIEELFRALSEVKKFGVDAVALEALKQRSRHQILKAAESPARWVKLVPQFLSIGSDSLLRLEIDEAYSQIQPEDLQTLAAEFFSPGSALYTMMSPNVQAQKKDSTYGLAVEVKDQPELVERWTEVFESSIPSEQRNYHVQLVPLELPQRTSPVVTDVMKEPLRLDQPQRGLTILYAANGEEPKGALAIEMRTVQGQTKTMAAAHLWIMALTDRIQSETSYLRTQGLEMSLAWEGSGLNLAFEGNSLHTLESLQWFLNQWQSFEPTEEEVARALRRWQLNHQQSLASSMSASLAAGKGMELMERYSHSTEKMIKAAQKLSAQDVVREVRSSLVRSDKVIIAHGDYMQSEIEAVADRLDQLSSKPLTAQQRRLWKTSGVNLPQPLDFWTRVQRGSEENGYGIYRAYSGPQADNLREMSAAYVLMKAVGEKVFDLNRSERGLGYVHDAYLSAVGPDRVFFHFVGQTEGEENAQLTQQGWEEVMDMVRQGRLSEDDFERAKQALITAYTQPISGLMAGVGVWQINLRLRNDPNARQRVAEILPTLTADEIYEVGRKYFAAPGAGFLQVVASREPLTCQEMLTSEVKTRRILRSSSR